MGTIWFSLGRAAQRDLRYRELSRIAQLRIRELRYSVAGTGPEEPAPVVDLKRPSLAKLFRSPRRRVVVYCEHEYPFRTHSDEQLLFVIAIDVLERDVADTWRIG